MPWWPGIFQFDIFLSVALSVSRCVFASEPSLNSSSFFHAIYPFSISVMVFLFLYFASYCWFSLDHLLTSVGWIISLFSSFFHQYLLIYSSSCVVRLVFSYLLGSCLYAGFLYFSLFSLVSLPNLSSTFCISVEIPIWQAYFKTNLFCSRID